jgi:predicted lipoprotein with Yx(FWY)xxD motif
MHTRPLTVKAFLATGLCAALMAQAAAADSHGNKHVHSREYQGEVYVMYRDHMALYTYDGDAPGVSNCDGDCAATWKPALLEPGTPLGENYAMVERADGSMQATFRGMPLYLYSGDDKPGDINGDGLDGAWHLARP